MLKEYPLQEAATHENFDEEAYLRANPSVRQLIANGSFDSGRAHFDSVGKVSGFGQRRPASDISTPKQAKLARIRPLMRTDIPMVETAECLDYLSPELRAQFSIIDTENISGHGYDETLMALVRKYEDGIILDCGAGRRPIYFQNVVNYEIVAYDSTDVLGVGEELPFKDNSFDAVFSIAVLEHVKDPFRCAREIIRVLKPGGELICAVPFLQPVHGYPNHFYNMTAQGLQNLFDSGLAIDNMAVTPGTGPVHTLTWFLRSWVTGLQGQTQRDFLNLRIEELIGHGSLYMDKDYVRELPEATNFELASACFLFAHKPTARTGSLETRQLPQESPATLPARNQSPASPLQRPVEEGPVLASMSNFKSLCQPLLEAWNPGSICEIGVENGKASNWLIEACQALGAQYHGVDPSIDSHPSPGVDGVNAFFHQARSLDYLARSPRHDVYFIDGDHNYATVSRELTAISSLAINPQDHPLIFLHDVSWPWARRDLYYRLQDIAPEERQDVTTGGSLRLEEPEPVHAGGFLPAGLHPFARRSSADKNGVLTAVEDFVATNPDWELVLVPCIFGLGILVHRDSLNPQRKEALHSVEKALKLLGPMLNDMEYNRIELLTSYLEARTQWILAVESSGKSGTLQAELRTAKAQIAAFNSEKKAIIAHLQGLLSEAYQKLERKNASLKLAKEQWARSVDEGQKRLRQSLDHVKGLAGRLLPSRRRRKSALEFVSKAAKWKPKVSLPKPTGTSAPSPQAPISGQSHPPASAESQNPPADALNFYDTRVPNSQNMLDIFRGDWSSAMPLDSGLSSEPGPAVLFNDPRIQWAAEEFSGFKDLNVLELGPLEGAHSWTLQQMGAKHVTAVEANRRAFLKCLCVKEAFKLDKVSFLLGDCVGHLKEAPSHYDAILACGVLYHMIDPMELLDLVCSQTDKVFLWTHYYDRTIIPTTDYLARRFADPEKAAYKDFTYEFARQSYQEAVQWTGFCGGALPNSLWLTRQSILDAFAHFGFSRVTVNFDLPNHPNGPSFGVCAQR
ncbi:methyltransferase domain-containing protein [Verrucomicrobium sp. BvORR106]|uniref:methyltransferase domain-containing protein n=1 Tax=Verrucomicrobium sp. BvORR106 TaxID=1403819 RepID=UPI0006903C79|nr:methyltransferase domain-containing protein [Verrucomicrobium sp. BvORR106]